MKELCKILRPSSFFFLCLNIFQQCKRFWMLNSIMHVVFTNWSLLYQKGLLFSSASDSISLLNNIQYHYSQQCKRFCMLDSIMQDCGCFHPLFLDNDNGRSLSTQSVSSHIYHCFTSYNSVTVTVHRWKFSQVSFQRGTSTLQHDRGDR